MQVYSVVLFDKDVPLHCNFDLLLIFSDCFFIQRFITFQHLQSVYHPVTGGNLLCCNHLIALCFSFFFFWDSGQKSNYLPVCLGCQRKIGVNNVPTIMGKSLGVYAFAFLGHFPIFLGYTLLHFWGIFQFTHAHPSPHLINTVGHVYIQIFFQVLTLYRVGGGRTARKFYKGCSVLGRNPEITENYEYCITVRRTLILDCRWWKHLTEFF